MAQDGLTQKMFLMCIRIYYIIATRETFDNIFLFSIFFKNLFINSIS